jgi:hypothetical protein
LRGLIQVCLQMRVHHTHHTPHVQVRTEYQSMCIAYNKQAILLAAEATSDSSSSSLQASGSSTSRYDKSSNRNNDNMSSTTHLTHQPSPDLQRVPEHTVSKLAQVRQAPDPKFPKHRQKKAVQTFTSTIVAVKS